MSGYLIDPTSTFEKTINDIVSRTPGGKYVHGLLDEGDVIALDAMSDKVHASNVDAGWWTDLHTGESLKGKRNLGELLCLVHSEVSEGFDGFLHDAADDKLTHRPMFEVELADVLIRVFDIVGGFGLALGAPFMLVDRAELMPGKSSYQINEDLNRLHRAISRAMEGHRKNKQHPEHTMHSVLEMNLAEVVLRVFHMARKLNLDLGGAFAEKRAYNASRADHKPENRKAAGGKAY